MCPATSSIVSRLRTDTRLLHDRVEAAIPILHPDATTDTYTTYLIALLRFHRPLERMLSNVRALRELPLDIDARWKVPHLEADLRTLDVDPDRDAADCERVPEIHDVRAALGALYVLDGATLGGRVIHRELSTRFPALMIRSARYLRGYGTATGTRWTELCDVLNSRPEPEADAIVSAAVQTFSTFGDWVEATAGVQWRGAGLIHG